MSTAEHIIIPPSLPWLTVALENSDGVKTFIINEGTRICARAFGETARAILLTGSLSRGEATIEWDGSGWRALGDATFLVIMDDPVNIDTGQIGAEIENSLILGNIRCAIVVVASTTSELSRMRPHIYAYELRERGKVVWGDENVLDLMPRFAAAEIPMEDGWWFLCNRIIEQLETAAKASPVRKRDAGIRYRIAKLYLSMAACYLLAIGQYEPSYQDRERRLRELAASPVPPLCPIPLPRFSLLVSQCTKLKMQGNAAESTENYPLWRDAIEDAEVLWRWTLSRIVGCKNNGNRAVLLALLAKHQPMLTRAKGWLRAALVQPRAFWHNLFRWARLATGGSPRYLVYGAAGELFFGGRSGKGASREHLAAIAAKLPLQSDYRQPLSWSSVAMMIADNFHNLLESNRS